MALERAVAALSDVSDGDPHREARLLLAHVLKCSSSDLLLCSEQLLSDQQIGAFDAAIGARRQKQPITQIIGKRAFWEAEFFITPDVLDPRPDTELLVELALAKTDAHRVLDLGTGSGCILCSVLGGLTQATGIGTDLSQFALDVAAKNVAELGLSDRAVLQQASWFENVEGEFDLILSNPPYITASDYLTLDAGVRNWEPRQALTDGTDGLQAYREIAQKLDQFLAAGGLALFEHGVGQSSDVMTIFKAAGFDQLRSYNDLNGKDRVVSVER